MASEVLGKITCPHCHSKDATVHRQASKNAKLYYRCYDGPNGPCGTVQITLEGGQKWIKDNIRSLSGAEVEEVAHEAAESAREAQLKAVKQEKRSGSFLESIFSGDDDE
ncbi:hypothetical protein J8L98_01360 [Pseudoalteromonas sp. MMG013]|uniref:hypothetical protein n=1 Tax=Pseudoalteromonas sp. MMG013 TaxID=2822687 RepID=UPI001B39048C|nr:hypothetical protein [Pseudoalteromonas sp. MMG013]MBQ4860337.1 hypothetical protein [Pseudoalteromonas sp. MMG013]